MKQNVALDRNIRNQGKYLLCQVVLCGLIPHGMLSLLQMASVSGKWSPAEIESYSNFFVCQWIPFWLVFLCYLRLQKKDRFSLMSVICAAVIILSFLPRFARRSVLTLVLTVFLIFAIELSALLKKGEGSGNRMIAGIAADRGILRAYWFWTLVFPCAVLISCEACTFEMTVVSPFQMLPIPGILLFDVLRCQKNQPPTVWSVFGMLATVPLSLLLVTIGPMARFMVYHLMSMGVGYGILFLMLIVYNLDQWKK